ncbi:ABC transporter ATP-binding protein [Niveibacterium sp. SC-1]|uniref:ABC transporter ATP-binding protein n=1 Tax=Niveibacterium sp. SC-1 TaxID=3135646 RepID=UPI00311DB605
MGLFGSVVHVPGIAPPVGEAAGIDMLQVTKRFGAFTALDGVSLSVAPGSFHALLGENGAGKSTLVKCLIGYQPADTGSLMVDGREQKIASPREAADLGIGMVFQHFTLAPNLTVAENLLLAQPRLPAVLDWRRERAALENMLADMPFKVPLGVLAGELAAGEKQKVEILKQLYLRRRFIILDEPTSVLTPGEADELLGFLKQRTRAGKLSVLMITHKFREVMAFADDVTVLRRGRRVGGTKVAETDPHQLSVWMMGADESVEAPAAVATPVAATGEEVLALDGLSVMGDQGLPAVQDVGLQVRAGEIVGVAGVSGNGQRELVEALLGQRRVIRGRIRIAGRDFHHRRGEIRALGVRSLPEEPLRNACVGEMSVAENIALRSFDRSPLASGPWLRAGALARQADEMISAFNVRTPSADAPIAALSGGNVQRAVLARELSAGEGQVKLLIVANPVFGLDFRAVAAIHARIAAARDAGCAVLLVSEDLDELLELSDRIVVMHAGRLVYECPRDKADVATLGHYMAGEAHAA